MVTTSVINCDPEIMSGVPVFMGTRVPIKNWLDYVQHGRPLDEFLDDFPTVEREQVVALVEIIKHVLLDDKRENSTG